MHWRYHEADKNPTVEEYLEKPGSKLARLVELCEHFIPPARRHLTSDGIPHVELVDLLRTPLTFAEDGARIDPPSRDRLAQLYLRKRAQFANPPDDMPPLAFADEVDTPLPIDTALLGYRRPLKILIFVCFRLYLDQIEKVRRTSQIVIVPADTRARQIFAAKGLHVSILQGDLSVEKRAELVRQFNEEGPHLASDGKHYSWIMIMTSVGQTGLNLSRAGVGLLYVGPPRRSLALIERAR